MIRLPALRRSPSLLLPMVMAVIVLYLAAGTGFASADPDSDLAEYEGDWSLVDPDASHESRMAAIDQAIDGLSWVMRKMARPVLRKSIMPAPRMQFIWDGQQLEQRLLEAKGNRARPVELGVEQHEGKSADGKPVLAAWARTESGLQLSWEQHQANGRNLYWVDSESGFLIVEHTINITAISDVEPIVFRSKFGRRGSPSVTASEPSLEAHLTP